MDSQSCFIMRAPCWEPVGVWNTVQYPFLENMHNLFRSFFCGPKNLLEQIRCMTLLFSIGPLEWKGAKTKKGWLDSTEHAPPQWEAFQRCTSQYQHAPNGRRIDISIQVVTGGSLAHGKVQASNHQEKHRLNTIKNHYLTYTSTGFRSLRK